MSCQSCSPQPQQLGRFVQGSPGQFYRTTGSSLRGLSGHDESRKLAVLRGLGGVGGYFGEGQTNWIPNVANEYVVAAAALVLLLVVMR